MNVKRRFQMAPTPMVRSHSNHRFGANRSIILFFDQAHSCMYGRKIEVKYPAIPDSFVIGGLLLGIVMANCKVIGDTEQRGIVFVSQNTIELRS